MTNINVGGTKTFLYISSSSILLILEDLYQPFYCLSSRSEDYLVSIEYRTSLCIITVDWVTLMLKYIS